MRAPVICSVRGRPSGVPKKPVVWHGEIWIRLPSNDKGDIETDIRAWRSGKPITKQQAQTVMGQLHAQLVAEHGKDSAVDSGFWLQSR